MNYQFIAIEGNIGAGKTTLSKMIAKRHDGKLVLEEFADNPFLPKFYNDASKYAFPLELSFLAERYQQLKDEMQIFQHTKIGKAFPTTSAGVCVTSENVWHQKSHG